MPNAVQVRTGIAGNANQAEKEGAHGSEGSKKVLAAVFDSVIRVDGDSKSFTNQAQLKKGDESSWATARESGFLRRSE